MLKRWLGLLMGLMMLWGNGAAAQDAPPTLAELIAADAQFSTLHALLDAADPALKGWLANPANQMTVFAPTNAAWDAYFADGYSLEVYLQQPTRLNNLLRYHILPALLMPQYEFEEIQAACKDYGTMLPDSRVPAVWDYAANNYSLNGLFLLLNAPLSAANGLLYPVDEVLREVNLVDRAGDHTPDDVATPTPAPVPPRVPLEVDADIVSVLQADGRFTRLVSLLERSPVYAALRKGDGVYMLFAPTDVAFEQFFSTYAGFSMESFTALYGEALVEQIFLAGYFAPETLDEHLFMQPNYCPLRRGYAAELRRNEGQFTINDAPVSDDVLYARNSVIFVTDGIPFKVPFRG